MIRWLTLALIVTLAPATLASVVAPAPACDGGDTLGGGGKDTGD
jgi:hypothetical protein